MTSFELVAGALALVSVVAAGTVVHELLHAAVLRAAGVPFEMRWLRDHRTTRLDASALGAWASVRLRSVPTDLPAWQLRAASMAPLALAAPLLAIAVGVVPDPFVEGSLVVQLAVVGWLACALPSPQDFSLFWYAEDVISGAVDPADP